MQFTYYSEMLSKLLNKCGCSTVHPLVWTAGAVLTAAGGVYIYQRFWGSSSEEEDTSHRSPEDLHITPDAPTAEPSQDPGGETGQRQLQLWKYSPVRCGPVTIYREFNQESGWHRDNLCCGPVVPFQVPPESRLATRQSYCNLMKSEFSFCTDSEEFSVTTQYLWLTSGCMTQLWWRVEETRVTLQGSPVLHSTTDHVMGVKLVAGAVEEFVSYSYQQNTCLTLFDGFDQRDVMWDFSGFYVDPSGRVHPSHWTDAQTFHVYSQHRHGNADADGPSWDQSPGESTEKGRKRKRQEEEEEEEEEGEEGEGDKDTSRLMLYLQKLGFNQGLHAKMDALRKAFNSLLTQDTTKNHLTVAGKMVVCGLVILNQADARFISAAFDRLVSYIEAPGHKAGIKRELASVQVYHTNFLDIVYEYIVMGTMRNSVPPPPQTEEQEFLDRLFQVLDLVFKPFTGWQPRAKTFLDVIQVQLLDLMESMVEMEESIFSQSEELSAVLFSRLEDIVQYLLEGLEA